ncbi:SdpI family protein [Luteococcus sp. H138]|uniref:SdpI family protein n=1 Tax=unclassified Luteococcus TaxID=2639923 RepID=UPI00313B6FF0
MSDVLAISLTDVICGVLMVVLGWMGAHGTLKRNGWAGIRVPATMKSDEAWRVAHAASSGWLIASGVVCLVVGLAVLALVASGLSANAGNLIGLAGIGAMTVLVIVGAVVGIRAANRVE